MWIYIIVAVFVLFAIFKERQALGCPNLPDGSDCDNANGKAVRGTLPVATDSTQTIYKKMEKAADFADRWVMWRIGVIISIPILFLIWYILYGRIPDERELVVGVVVISAIVYFVMSFYKFHLIDYAKNNIDAGIEILSTRTR
jgi:RsiW-degrading membrane proteinase PrsW (M82 family)